MPTCSRGADYFLFCSQQICMKANRQQKFRSVRKTSPSGKQLLKYDSQCAFWPFSIPSKKYPGRLQWYICTAIFRNRSNQRVVNCDEFVTFKEGNIVNKVSASVGFFELDCGSSIIIKKKTRPNFVPWETPTLMDSQLDTISSSFTPR